MFGEIKENLKFSFSLLKKSKGTLLTFELIYKIAASFVVLPFTVWLITTVSSSFGLRVISGENFTRAVFSPFVIGTVLFLMFILGAFTMLEISFVTLCYSQAANDKPISFFRMLKIAAEDSKRVLKPKNLIFLPFFVVLVPTANSAIISSLLSGFPTGDFIISRISSNRLYMSLLVVLAVLAACIIIAYSVIFLEYCLFDSSARGAIIAAKKLLKGNRTRMVFVCAVNITLYTVLILALKTVAYILLSMIIFLFSNNTKLFAILLTLNSTVKNIFDFAVPSMIVVCAYAVITSYYFGLLQKKGMHPPRVFQPLFGNAAKKNAKIAVVSALICLLSIVGYTFLNVKADIKGFTGDNTLVMAHRGASKDAPENTLPAFEKAVEYKADYIELDVQETKDGAVVVTHDVNTKRVTGVNDYVWNMTLDEIKKLDAAYYFDGFSDVRIPTLQEVFEDVGGEIKFNIELKYNRHTKNLAKSVADIITEYGLEDDCVITSSKKAALEDMKELMPDIPCGYILSVSIGKYYNLECADFFSLDLNYVTKKSLAKCHRVAKPVNAWTVNTTETMEKMIALGVDSIITDDPLKARTVITASEDPLSILKYLLQLS